MELEKLAHFESELTFLVKWSPDVFCGIHLRTISRVDHEFSPQITLLKLLRHLPATNKLIAMLPCTW